MANELARFEARVERGRSDDDCWTWTGSSSRGYGQFNAYGVSLTAYKFSYELHVGPVPAGLELDHLCRNRLCVNPSHLEAVTHLVNRQRAALAQTHCKNGHEFTEANTYQRPDRVGRLCRECQRAANRRHYHTHKETQS